MPDRHAARPYRSIAIAATAGLLALAVGAQSVAAAARTALVSISTSGVKSDDTSSYPDISATGRFVAFMSESDRMVPADKNGQDDVFVRDRSTGKTEWISRSLPGEVNDDSSNNPAISADGRYVVLHSDAANLVKNGTSAWQHVYRYDREKRVMRLVTQGPNGVEGGGSDPSISASGRFVAFESIADNLVAEDTNGKRDVFVRDMATKVNRQVRGKQGAQGDGGSSAPAISADGRWVAFESYATNLVANDTSGDYDIFLSDLDTGRIRRVSRGLEGAQPDGQSLRASISSNGRWVAFDSWGPLVGADTNAEDDIYVRGPLR